ncbi:MAG: hypothetical protein WA733_12445 [Methylocystis sp.]
MAIAKIAPAPGVFVASFPMKRDTIHSEPVVAWAVAHGHAPISRYSQLRLWRKHDIEAGATMIAERMKLKEVRPAEAVDGDIVVARHPNSEAKIMGIQSEDFVIVAGFGRIFTARCKILRAWRI